MQTEPHKRTEHSLVEDALAFVLGASMAALGVAFLTHLGLITGQTAGLGVLLSYVTGWSFGAVFFAVNLPFYLLGYLRLGLRFTIKSFIAVSMVSAAVDLMPQLLTIAHLNPAAGAFLAGALCGSGLLILFRHGASLGGVGVLGLVLQEKMDVQAGWVQLGFDILLFAAAIFVLDPALVAYSLAGAVLVNVIVGVNHRKDRYTGR